MIPMSIGPIVRRVPPVHNTDRVSRYTGCV
jgi:hypothetical protein